jgi:hypothetical protein
MLEGSCVFPTDESDELVVTLEAPSTLVVVGATVRVTARVSRRLSDGQLQPIPRAIVEWLSSDPAVVNVEGSPDGSAALTGLQSGSGRITATATSFTRARSAVLAIRVANPIEIDSINPAIVRYGDKLTVYGVGLDELERVTLGEADLIPDPVTYTEAPGGTNQLSFWVPYPAATGRATLVTHGGASTVAPTPTTVLPIDLYHELGLDPPTINLTGVAARQPDTLFYNPALALTDLEGSDGFRLAASENRSAITITVSSESPAVTLLDPVVSVGPSPFTTFPATDEQSLWAIGLGGQNCRNTLVPFTRPVARAGPFHLVRALKDLPSADILLGITGDPPGRYGLTVQAGYHTADERIVPDRFEENDHCAGADLNFRGSVHFDLPFSDTLTMDNPYEVDWFRFSLPPGPEEPTTVFLTLRSAARPFGATDSSNVGLLILDSDANVLAEAHEAGSSETLNLTVDAPRDYYAIVLDEAGVPTRYALCIAIGTVCEFPSGGEP